MIQNRYEGMSIFQEAKQRKIEGFGYCVNRFKLIWKSKKPPWQHLAIIYGIRRSEKWQLIPIWNVSDNCHRAIMFGFWKLYFTISYARAYSFNQDRKLPFRRTLWKFYQLFF
jgi:hypothetical protein